MTEARVAWHLFELDPAGYEEWYATRRGQRADRAERALLERLLEPYATARSALEVGCGTGHFLRWLGGRSYRVVGVDRAPGMLAEARRRDARLVQCDAHALPIRSGAVDLIVLVTTLEFVEEPALAVAEAVRVARQGVVAVALNRRSQGGLSRRWGRDARGSLLARARDFTLTLLRELASTAAGPRLFGLRWASALFPGGVAQAPMRVPFGDVIGIAVELTQ